MNFFTFFTRCKEFCIVVVGARVGARKVRVPSLSCGLGGARERLTGGGWWDGGI